MTKEKDIDE